MFDKIMADINKYQWPSSNSNWTIYQSQNTKHSSCFITQSYFTVPKNIRLNSMYYFIIKINLLDIEFQNFMDIHKTWPEKTYFFS